MPTPFVTARPLCVALLLLALCACASPQYRHDAVKYYQAGEAALASGNLPQAKEMFTRALSNSRLAGLGPASEAQVQLKLGRVAGNLCQYDEAEQLFQASITQYAAAYGETSPRNFAARIELAQFSYDVGRYEKAVKYFEAAFPSGLAAGQYADPQGFAAIMTDYADALQHSGKAAQAAQAAAKAKAAAVGGGGKQRQPAERYVRYPKRCD